MKITAYDKIKEEYCWQSLKINQEVNRHLSSVGHEIL